MRARARSERGSGGAAARVVARVAVGIESARGGAARGGGRRAETISASSQDRARESHVAAHGTKSEWTAGDRTWPMASARARARRAGPEVVSSSATPRVGRRARASAPAERRASVAASRAGLRQPEPDDAPPRGGDRASTSRRGEPTRWRRARRRRRRRPLVAPSSSGPSATPTPSPVPTSSTPSSAPASRSSPPETPRTPRTSPSARTSPVSRARARVRASPTVPLPPPDPSSRRAHRARARRAESEHPDDPSAPRPRRSRAARDAARHAARVAKDLERRLFEDANVLNRRGRPRGCAGGHLGQRYRAVRTRREGGRSSRGRVRR